MAITKNQNLHVRTGNTVVIKFGGDIVGLLQDLRASDDYSPEPASGIGDIHVVEHVPTMARHTLSCSAMTLIKQSMRQAGVSLENGDDALRGLVFDIEIYDKRSDTTNTSLGNLMTPGLTEITDVITAEMGTNLLRKYTKVSFASGDIDIRKHTIVVSNAQFNAIDASGNKI